MSTMLLESSALASNGGQKDDVSAQWQSWQCSLSKRCIVKQSQNGHLSNGEDKSTHKSTTKVIFSTEIIRLGQSMTVITTV